MSFPERKQQNIRRVISAFQGPPFFVVTIKRREIETTKGRLLTKKRKREFVVVVV